MSTERASAWDRFLAREIDGVWSCYCGTALPNRRRTFCSPECRLEANVRANPGMAAHYVYQRDQGVCAECGLDTKPLEIHLHELKSLAVHIHWPPLTAAVREEAQREYAAFCDWLRECGFNVKRDSRFGSHQRLWQADHIVPVADGGGECGLSNYRTLCTPCHKEVTRIWQTQRAARRRGHGSLPMELETA